MSYAYAARGTRTSVAGPDGTAVYAFDAHGRMITGGGVAYAYDGLGRLVERGGEALAYAGQSNNLVAGGGELVFRSPGGEALSSAATDGSGAAALLSDGHGDVTGSFAVGTGVLAGSTACSPFGRVTAWAGDAGVLGYQGEYTDPGSGQVNMHARWYDPAAGGFSSRDSWTLNPVPSIQANRYTYANASPLLHTDPSGHLVQCGYAAPVCLGATLGGGAAAAGPPGALIGGAVVLIGGIAGYFFFSGPGPDHGLRPSPRPGASPTPPGYRSGSGGLPQPSWDDLAAALRAQADAALRVKAAAGGGGLTRSWGQPGGGGNGSRWDTTTIPLGPPPPPPPWEQILAKLLATVHARPAAEAVTDAEHERFVDESLTRSLKDLGLTDKQLERYFRYFPGFQDGAQRRDAFSKFLAGWNDQPRNCMTGGRKSWVYYHPLDRQNHDRATGVTACLSKEEVDYRGRGKKADPSKDTEIMGGDTARGRGTNKTNPAGWQHLDGVEIWDRAHLLGRQLGGTGRDRRNLVKMYKIANSEVMREYEGIVRRRLDAGERIFYASIPMYEGGNPIPETVEIFALGSSGWSSQWTVYNTPDGLPPTNGATP